VLPPGITPGTSLFVQAAGVDPLFGSGSFSNVVEVRLGQ